MGSVSATEKVKRNPDKMSEESEGRDGHKETGGAFQRGSWGVLGAILAALGALLAALGRSWSLLGRVWPLLARSWALMGRSWPLLGRS